MTETYLAMVKLKLGIRGIIQESKRLHKIGADGWADEAPNAVNTAADLIGKSEGGKQ